MNGFKMHSQLKILCSLTPVLFGVLVAPAGAQERVDRRVATGATPNIRIMVPHGSVRVLGREREEIHVTGTVDGTGELYVGGTQGSAKLGVWDDGGSATVARLEVRVPAGATVWLKTEGADVSVSGVRGGVDAYSVTGSVRVEGRLRQLHVESMAGEVRVLASAPSVRAKTASGAITFRGSAEDAELSSVSGPITVEAPPLGRGRFESVSGDIRFRGGVAAGGSLDFHTHDGRVELLLPPDLSADVALSTVKGSVRSELRSASAPREGRELDFVAGAGGARLTARTFSGPVVLRSVSDPLP